MSTLSVADEDTDPTGTGVPATADYAWPYTSYATSSGDLNRHPDAPAARDSGLQQPHAAQRSCAYHSPEQARAFGKAVLTRRCEGIAAATQGRRNRLWSAACQMRSLWLSDGNAVPSWDEPAAALLRAGRACAARHLGSGERP